MHSSKFIFTKLFIIGVMYLNTVINSAEAVHSEYSANLV